MTSIDDVMIEITPQVLLKAYACGIFPMAESAEDPTLYWIEPERRGILPLERFHVPARLARTLRADRFRVVCDRDFEAVVDGCAEPQPGRARTWINTRIRKLYRALFECGHCHTVEVEREDYHHLLEDALEGEADFYFFPPDAAIAGGVVLQSVTQTS